GNSRNGNTHPKAGEVQAQLRTKAVPIEPVQYQPGRQHQAGNAGKARDKAQHGPEVEIIRQPHRRRANNGGYTDLMVDGAPSPHQSDTTLRWLIDRLRS